MTAPFPIRRATIAYAAAIKSCAQQAYAQYVAAIGRMPAPMVADFEALIAADHVYVATEPSNAVQGFIVFYKVADHVLLENVAVRPSAGGKGIGKQLIEFCETHARGHGAKSVQLYTNEKMTQNLSLYPHLGYRETDRRNEDGFNRVYFEKIL